MYQIDTTIPMPKSDSSRAGRGAIYPFAEMPIGGSFSAAPIDATMIGNAAKSWKRRHSGWDYRTRKTAEEFRIWRTA